MRGNVLAFLALGLVLAASSVRAADEEAVARATIEEAIRAQGGLDRLMRTLSLTRVGKCEISGLKEPVPATGEIAMHLPDQCRWALVLDRKGAKLPLHHAVNGDKGWRASEGGAPKDLTKAELEEYRQSAYVAWVSTLVPLVQGPPFQLSPLPPTNLNGSPTDGVKAVLKDRPDLKLYFDKATHRLAKVEWKGKYATLDAQCDILYSDYKEREGIPLPMHWTIDVEGQKVAEWTFTEMRFVEKYDEATFNHP